MHQLIAVDSRESSSRNFRFSREWCSATAWRIMLSWLPIRLYKVRVEIPRSAATRLDGHCRRPLLIENLQACAKIVSAEIDGGGPGVLRCPADRLRPFPSRAAMGMSSATNWSNSASTSMARGR